MVHMSIIEARLSQLGLHVSALFKPEIRELQKILVEGEEIISVVPGRYFGGFALLSATDRRLILIDKKVAILTTEIIPYDMISEVDFGARMLDATVVIYTVNKQHRFTSLKHRHKLRELTTYIQQRVIELRYGTTALAVPVPEPSAPLAEHLSNYTLPISDKRPVKAPGHLRQLVGAAALHGTPWSHVNPYTKTSFMVRTQLSGLPKAPLRELS